MKLRFFKNRLFANSPVVKTGGGLFATVEELIEQKQYVAYLKNFHQKLAASNQAGDVKSAFKGRGIELEEIRAYNFGDDVRDIDWRVTARRQTPYTRLYAEEKDREIYVLLDLSPQMVFGTRKELKSVSAAKISALLGWLSMENRDRFGLAVFDGVKTDFYKPGNNRAALTAMLKKVAETTRRILEPQKNAGGDLSKAVKLLNNRLKNRATVFVVSDFNQFDDMLKKSLSALCRKNRVYCLNIFDVLEENAPRPGEYMAVSPGGKRLVFNTADTAFVRAYNDYFAAKRLKIKEFCRSFRARYLEVRTDLELYGQLKIF